MLKHKYTKQIFAIVIAFVVIMIGAFILLNSNQDTQEKNNTRGKQSTQSSQNNNKKTMQYENELFKTDVVHTIDINIKQFDWNNILKNASKKEYQKCDVVIDGKTFQNAAIRAKGNSSLSSVSRQGLERYSFKIEFDHYKDGSTCWGLDKLSLNNIIQDKTYMKDYLSYTLMREMGADAPLCSYIFIKVNGKDFGLYLAVEGVEESFAQRNYGTDYGNLYKPETSNDMGNMSIPNRNNNQPNGNKSSNDNNQNNQPDGNMPSNNNIKNNQPDGNMPGNDNNQNNQPNINMPSNNNNQDNDPNNMDNNNRRFGNDRGFGGMSNASDVALKYTDDNISSYSNIFDNAIFKASDDDKKRLISSIKQINSGENLDKVVDVDEVLRYFVVHNFLDNYDSYTGNMLHNYYLYEKDGKISMIAWDYNLAFGGFGMGRGMGRGMDNDNTATSSTSQATTYVNYPIDTPVSGTSMEERPLLNNLLSDANYKEQYHDLFDDFISNYFESGYCNKVIDSVSKLITPYVKKDKTAFFTADEFTKGTKTLKNFCELRAKSIRGQLMGTIPSTTDGQKNSETLVDASSINMNDLGDMGGFGQGRYMPNMYGGFRNRGNWQNGNGEINKADPGTTDENSIDEKSTSSDNSIKNDSNTSNNDVKSDNTMKSANTAKSNNSVKPDNTAGKKIDISNIVFGVIILVLLIGLVGLNLYRRKK